MEIKLLDGGIKNEDKNAIKPVEELIAKKQNLIDTANLVKECLNININTMAHHIHAIESRAVFVRLLENNPRMIILKFGANWCGPCKTIETEVKNYFRSLPQDGSVIYGEIDVDQSMDVYAYLKANRRVNGIPVILCYVRGQTNGVVPTLSYTGADKAGLNRFFTQCNLHL